MYPGIARYLFYDPVQRLRGENYAYWLKRFHEAETWSPERIRKEQSAALSRMVEETSGRFQFIADRIEGAGIRGPDSVCRENLKEIPPLTRQDVRREAGRISVAGYRVSWRRTSGTTGEPLLFPKDRRATAAMEGVMHGFYSWFGIRPCDRQARIWGVPLRGWPRRTFGIKDSVLNRRRLSAFCITEESCRRFHRALERFRPTFLYAYPSAAAGYVGLLQKQGINPRQPSMKVVIATGEPLLSEQRTLLREAFRVPVVSEYGTTENGIIGFECEHGTMHLNVFSLITQILDPDEEGYGSPCVTELESRCFPFLRYHIGDRIRLLTDRSCHCGRNWPAVEISSAREGDFALLPDGRRIFSTAFAYALAPIARHFQVIQESPGRFRVRLVPLQNRDSGEERDILRRVEDLLGSNCSVLVEEVDKIPPDPSGKLRYFVRGFDETSARERTWTRED